MKIATFNCNSVRVRMEAILAWLAAHRPDVLALQETKTVDADFPAEAFRAAGWQVCFRGEKSYNGVALVTKKVPDEVAFGLDDGDDGVSETRLVRARLGKVSVVNTYVPQGQSLDSDKFQFKLKWFKRFADQTAKWYNPSRDKVVWVGDLNVAPTPADVYDSKRVWPHVCHCQEVIDAFAGVTRWGWEDVFRKHLPEPQTYTFWDYRQRGSLERNRGWRIDHVLATPSLAKTSRSCMVDIEPRRAERPSDHTFVMAEFGA